MNKRTQIKRKSESEQVQAKAVNKEVAVETAVSTPYIPALQRAYADPGTITPNDARVLQRAIGNQAMRRLVIQRKMTVGPVGDKYEQEADAVAKQVVSTLNNPQQDVTQRQEDEDDLVQMKPSSMLGGGDLSSDIEGQIQNTKGGGRPLAPNTQSSMERAFNADFSGVKVHTGAQSDTLNRSINARAFTTGRDIFFRGGEYNPESTSGKTLLAHELTHTLQQGGAHTQRKTDINTTIAPQNIIQPYRLVNFGDYDIGATGATFKSQEIDRRDNGAKHITKSKEIRQTTFGLSSESETTETKSGDTIEQGREHMGSGTGPPLKVAKTGELAIENTAGEARLFYADNNIIEASNAKLRSIGSPISMRVDASQSLSVPDAQGAKHPVSAVEPLFNNKISETIGNISICTDFVKNVLGASGRASRVAVFQKATWEDAPNPNTTHEAPVSSSEQEPVKEIVKKIEDGNPEGGQGMKESLTPYQDGDNDTTNESTINTYQNMSRSKLGGQERELGINKYAQPEVGEGFVTKSIREKPDQGGGLSTVEFQNVLNIIDNGTEEQKRNMDKNSRAVQHLWGIHYAGVVAKSGADSVTFENYNRDNAFKWELDTLLTNIFQEFAAFRGLVDDAIQQEKHGLKDGISVTTSTRISQLRKVVAEAKDMEGLGEDLQTRLQDFTDSYKGLLVNQNKLFHFKMYGTEEGQSFHEQWQDGTENSVTLRIRESGSILAESIVRQIQTTRDEVFATFAGLGNDVAGLNPIMSGMGFRIVNLADQLIADIDRSPHKVDYKRIETNFKLLLKQDAKQGLLDIFDHAKAIAEQDDAELATDPTTEDATTQLDQWIRQYSSFTVRHRSSRQQKVAKLTSIRAIVQQLKEYFNI